MVEEEMYLFLCPIISVSSGVANIGKKEGKMTIEEIEKLLDTGREQRIILYRDDGDDIDIRGVVDDLLSEVKRLREGIEKHRLEQPVHFKEDIELYKLLEDK